MVELLRILECLSDAEFHSGEELAENFGVSRTAIWKQVQKLNTILPLKISSASGKGYRLQQALSVLNRRKIEQHVSGAILQKIYDIEILVSCPSTNQFLLESATESQRQNRLVLAEMQTQGRGRRGKEWVSPFASNIYMSLLWHFDISMAEVAGLSLIVAISIARALKKAGVGQVMLKWPNDVYVDNRKLAGVLLELRGELNSPCQAVIGMGINVNMPPAEAEKIDQQWVDMQTILKSKVNRNELVAQILNELVAALEQFNKQGFAAFVEQWQTLDLLANREISIENHQGVTTAIARGVNNQGALLVEQDNRITALYSGDVSVRKK